MWLVSFEAPIDRLSDKNNMIDRKLTTEMNLCWEIKQTETQKQTVNLPTYFFLPHIPILISDK